MAELIDNAGNNNGPVVENSPGNVEENKPVTPEVNQEENNPDDDEKLGENGVKALNAERDARKEAEKKLAEATRRIEDFEDASRTEEEKRERAYQRLQNENTELQDEVKKLSRTILVRDALEEVKLPKKVADRIHGDTYEEILADAKELKELLGDDDGGNKPRKPAPVPEAGNEQKQKTSTADLFSQAVSNAFLR